MVVSFCYSLFTIHYSGKGDRFRARERRVKFRELIRLLEANGFTLVKQKGSVRYYGKPGWAKLIRVDSHGSKEVPTGREEKMIELPYSFPRTSKALPGLAIAWRIACSGRGVA